MYLSKFVGLRRLTKSMRSSAGRNQQGRITVRHRGGGRKHKYRVVDFDRSKYIDLYGLIRRVERDPNRNVPIALVCYQNGVLAYHLGVQGLKSGSLIANGINFEPLAGNSLP